MQSYRRTSHTIFDIFQPSLYSFRVLLVCSPERSLCTQSRLLKQSTDRTPAEFDSIIFQDKLSDHGRSPQSKRKFELKGIFPCDGIVDPFHGFTVQFRRTPASLLCIKPMHSAIAIKGHPSKNSAYIHTKNSCSLTWYLACMDADDCPFAHFRQNLVVQFSLVGFHAYTVTKNLYHCNYYEMVNKIHIVWVTKYRYSVLRGNIAARARDIIKEICDAYEVQIIKGHVSAGPCSPVCIDTPISFCK